MYEKHFGLTALPFHAGPDPRSIYLTPSLREALAVLSYGVSSRRGFVQLTGPVGTGKTTLLNLFLESLRSRAATTAFIFNPHLNPDDFFDLILADFGMERIGSSKSQALLRLNARLLEIYKADRLAVVLVDEAHQLSTDVLEELRLLTNLETPSHKLLQIVLCGQPELETLLDRASLSQVRQRISLRCRTVAFSPAQTAEYIDTRMRSVGTHDREIFEAAAIGAIHAYTAGVPRLINALCDQALIETYCDGAEKVTPATVKKTACDLGLPGALRVPFDRRAVRVPFEDEVVEPVMAIGARTGEKRL